VLAVKGDAVATPEAFVVAVVVAVPLPKVPEAPEAGAVKVTVAPDTALPAESLTVAVRPVAKAVATGALCPDPPVAVMAVAGPAVLVRLKLTGLAPVAKAVTLYGPPAVVLATNVVAVATPTVFVSAVVLVVPFVNFPDAPDVGAWKMTITPETGFLLLSVTVTPSSVPKAVPTAVD
jgi:hypothetical protein